MKPSARSTPPLLRMPPQPSGSDKISELLPSDWSANKELYSLRYKAKDDTSLLLKAILDDSILTFYLMVSRTGWRVHRVDTFSNF